MNTYPADDINANTPELNNVNLPYYVSTGGKGMQELESAQKALTRVDLDVAHSYEKLVNLHVLLMYLLALENDLEAMTTESFYILADSIEIALVFDLLSAILDSEVRELESFMDTLQAEIVDAGHKISSCRHLGELVTTIEVKLHDSEESLKRTREQVVEVKMQSAKFQRSLLVFGHEKWKYDESMHLSENGQLSNIDMNSNFQTVEQRRHILRMLDKSLARELELENKLSEFRQNEEELNLKLHHTEQVAFRMEEGAELVWGRFLEAENAAEVLLGISKELLGRLQIVQFNLNGSTQRECEAKSTLQGCMEQLKAKDAALHKLENSIAEHIAGSSEVFALREKVKLLEEKLKESEFQLKNANVSNETSQEQLNEMERIVDMLKESIYEAESRAESADAKVTQLMETNLELTEELNFLKSSTNDTAGKVSMLEKQVRELEIQLQHAKASSEASQEQQNMLYSAIWDMETLIEDLKSKVTKAESKTENAEEQCIILSETNLELNKEINFLRARMEWLETSLDQATDAKLSSAKEIDVRTKVIMDMVMQLATERERIQKQLYSLTKDNKILVENLRNAGKDPAENLCNNGDGDSKGLLFSNLTNAACTKTSEEAVTVLT